MSAQVSMQIQEPQQTFINSYWPCSDRTTEIVKKVALGVFVGISMLPTSGLFSYGIRLGMTALGLDHSTPQDVTRIFDSIDTTALKVLMIAYITFIGPIVEEVIFRMCLHNVMEYCLGKPNSTTNKVLRTVGNGLIFGAAHVSLKQGWANVPIFAVTALGGCILAGLRECTGDIIAPCAAHITYNTMIMGVMLLSENI